MFEYQKKIDCFDIGLKPYQEVWQLQEFFFKEAVKIKSENREKSESEKQLVPNRFIFCEHPAVITLGTSGEISNLLISEDLLKLQNIEFVRVNRGGDVTLHNPGQIVGYPILDLDQYFTDIHIYMRMLEEVIILTLKDYGISGHRLDGFTGVWLEPNMVNNARKICAMGVRTSRWITMHGFALNVNNNLNQFDFIVPCGIKGKQVTSLSQELNRTILIEEVKAKIKFYFEKIFETKLTSQSVEKIF